MGVHVEGRYPSVEDQIWDRFDRLRDAGPVAASYLAAHERLAREIERGQPAPSATGPPTADAAAWRHRIGVRLIALGRLFEAASPAQAVADDRFPTARHRVAS